MNKALWQKTFVEARVLLVACTGLIFGFQWLFVWISSRIELGAIAQIIKLLPIEFQRLAGVPAEDVATTAGRIAVAYVDPVVLVTTAVWAIARGSDSVSGEIDRGTMEMVLAQPVRRIEVLGTHAAVTLAGAALISIAAWAGTSMGLATVTLPEQVSPRTFLAPAANVFAMMCFLAGVSTMVSSFDRYRWRTIGVLGSFYIFSLICEVVGRMVTELHWLRYLTFLAIFEPQQMVSEPAKAWTMTWQYDGLLLGLGVLCYCVAAVVFCHRDLPAPL